MGLRVKYCRIIIGVSSRIIKGEFVVRNHLYIRNLVLTALFLACGLMLPSFFHMLGAGTVFLPLHIPVLICGLVCGWQWGLLCGLILPLLSSILTGMPPLFPTACSMMLELATYGCLTGLLLGLLERRTGRTMAERQPKLLPVTYLALIGAMLAGRLVAGLADALFYGIANLEYGLQIFLSAKFVVSLPGIIIQLVFVPPIVLAIRRVMALPRLAKSGAYDD